MRSTMLSLSVLVTILTALGSVASARAAEPDWKAVEQALGKTGQLQAGDVFRIGMPRTDLSVTVKGVPVKAGFALGSYAAFKRVGDHAMVMGDLVLLDQEVPAVMSGLFGGGLEVTAVHNHLNEMSPHVMYMHYEGHGDAVQLARALRQALSASATPLGGAGPGRRRAGPRREAHRAGPRPHRPRPGGRRLPGDRPPCRDHHGERRAATAGHGRGHRSDFPGAERRRGRHHR
jgi:Domain of Unknown Function (DUF1259)